MLKSVLIYFILLHAVGWYHCDIGGLWNGIRDATRSSVNRLLYVIVLAAGILAVTGTAG